MVNNRRVSDSPSAKPAPPTLSSAARLLRLLHHEGTLSRAQLTRITGLNRSTVGVLISQLVEADLVIEGAPSSDAQVGRPSPTISVNPKLLALAVHPEVDAVTIALVGMAGNVVRKIRYETERVPTASEAANIAAAVVSGMRAELEENFTVVGVGVAVPGLVSDNGIVRHAPALGWREAAFGDSLEEALGYKSWVANDASLAAEAEMKFGQHVAGKDLIYLNGGPSGIGGGIVSNGALLRGAAGFAGEIGHTFVRSEGRVCDCGAIGCLESEVRLAPLLELIGSRVESDDLGNVLALSDDPQVAAEVRRQLSYLCVALRNIVNVLNPQTIVFDGFLAALLDADSDFLVSELQLASLPETYASVELVRSALGSNLMLVAAAEQAFAPLLADPLGWSTAAN